MPAAEHCVILLGGGASSYTGDLDEGKLARMLLSMLLWEHRQAGLPASPLQDEHCCHKMEQTDLRPSLLGAAGVPTNLHTADLQPSQLCAAGVLSNLKHSART